MLTNDDKQWIRDEIHGETGPLKSDIETLKSDVATLKSDVETLKSDMKEVKDGIQRINISIENYLIPLLTEVASAYSGSDIEFQKRAESLGKMQEDVIIGHKMISNHEIRIKALEVKENLREAKDSFA